LLYPPLQAILIQRKIFHIPGTDDELSALGRCCLFSVLVAT
jgi:hypothetical protein